MSRLEQFGKLSPEQKIKHLMGELVLAFKANSICYDLNEILAIYPGYETFVWNAAMILVERGNLGLIQTKIGSQIRWIVTYTHVKVLEDQEKFHCPLAKV